VPFEKIGLTKTAVDAINSIALGRVDEFGAAFVDCGTDRE
jgi:hypothetical protein